jgi:predicted RNA-binding Zn ribbon-like protein
MLHGPEDLARWTALSRLAVDDIDLAVDDIDASPGDLAKAKDLRIALWGLSMARAHGRPVRPADVAAVREAALGAPPVPEMTSGLRRVWAAPVTGAQVVSAIARDAIDLFTGPFAGRIRECAAGDCYLIFVDTSRPGKRRWCSMERCGNRHKVHPPCRPPAGLTRPSSGVELRCAP